MFVITNKKTGKSFIAERIVTAKYNFATFYVKNMDEALQTLGDPRKLSPFIKKKDAIGNFEFLAFHTKEQTDLFLTENKELIKQFYMIEWASC